MARPKGAKNKRDKTAPWSKAQLEELWEDQWGDLPGLELKDRMGMRQKMMDLAAEYLLEKPKTISEHELTGKDGADLQPVIQIISKDVQK